MTASERSMYYIVAQIVILSTLVIAYLALSIAELSKIHIYNPKLYIVFDFTWAFVKQASFLA